VAGIEQGISVFVDAAGFKDGGREIVRTAEDIDKAFHSLDEGLRGLVEKLETSREAATQKSRKLAELAKGMDAYGKHVEGAQAATVNLKKELNVTKRLMQELRPVVAKVFSAFAVAGVVGAVTDVVAVAVVVCCLS